MTTNDTFNTILKPSTGETFKDKNSKFLGYAFPVSNEDNVKTALVLLKKEHPNARHFCYAYQLGEENLNYRINDGGEPKNSAGMPIYGQIKSFEVTNILVVVIRYYGGIKLGVSGLINAYKTAAKLALEATEIVQQYISTVFQLEFNYKHMSKVFRIIKTQGGEITSQRLETSCTIQFSIRQSKAKAIFEIFSNFFEVEIKML